MTPDVDVAPSPHPLYYSNRAPYVWIQLWTIPEIHCSLLLKWRMSDNSAKQQAVVISQVRTALLQSTPSSLVSESLLQGKRPRTAALLLYIGTILYCFYK